MFLNKLFIRVTALSLALISIFTFNSFKANAESLPRVFVTNVTTLKSTYKSGDTVAGTITLRNGENKDLPEVFYDVSLAGGYSTAQGSFNIPSTIYDTKNAGKTFVPANSDKTVPFMYVLPQGISGDNLGIHIDSRVVGNTLGWGDVKIKVTGGLPTLSINKAWITVAGSDYGLQYGPTIYASTTGMMNVTLSNKNSKTITVTPSVNVYDRNIGGSILKTYTTNAVTIKAGGVQNVPIPVDTLKNTPKVYEAEVSFIDASGAVRASKLAFRYIVSNGPIATIQSVTSDLKGLAKIGDKINLNVTYSGSPFDIASDQSLKIGAATLDISLYDSNSDFLIGHSAVKGLNFDVSLGVASTSVLVTSQSKMVRAEVSVIKDGKKIGEYKMIITPPENSWPIADKKLGEITNNTVANIVVIVLVIVIIISLLIWRKKRMSKISPKPLIVLFALISFGCLFGMTTTHVYAGDTSFGTAPVVITTSDWVTATTNEFNAGVYNRPLSQPTLTLANPAGTNVYKGSPFLFSGVLLDVACDNSDFSMTITANVDGKQIQATGTSVMADVGHNISNKTTYFGFNFDTTNLSFNQPHVLNFSYTVVRQKNIDNSKYDIDAAHKNSRIPLYTITGNYSGKIIFNVVPKDCIAPGGGNKISSGSSQTFYKTGTVAYGGSCESEVRLCTDGNLSGSYQFLQCNPNNPPAPTSPIGYCAGDGTVATVSWTLPSGVDSSLVRVYDQTTYGGQSVNACNGNGICTGVSGSSYSFETTPGHTYAWWAHSGNAQSFSVDPTGGTVSCPTPGGGGGGGNGLSCGGSIPSGGIACNGSIKPNTATNWHDIGTSINSCNGANACEYYVSNTFSCTGAVPTGATVCPDTTTTPSSANYPWRNAGGDVSSCPTSDTNICQYYFEPVVPVNEVSCKAMLNNSYTENAYVGQQIVWVVTAGDTANYYWKADGISNASVPSTGGRLPITYSSIGLKKVSLITSGNNEVPCDPNNPNDPKKDGLRIVNNPVFKPY